MNFPEITTFLIPSLTENFRAFYIINGFLNFRWKWKLKGKIFFRFSPEILSSQSVPSLARISVINGNFPSIFFSVYFSPWKSFNQALKL